MDKDDLDLFSKRTVVVFDVATTAANWSVML